MIKTISIIIVGVAIFGIIFFIIVKNFLKRKIDYLVAQSKTKK